MTDLAVKSFGARPLTGSYTGPEKRGKDVMEARRTHFSLGNHPRIVHSQQRVSYQAGNNANQFGKQGSIVKS
jgi:hypothetical protein